MIKITHSLIVTSVLFYLVVAQQDLQPQPPQQPIAAPGPKVCQQLTTKPSAKTEKYHVNQGNTTNACIVAQFAAYFEVEQGKYVELNNSSVTNASSCQVGDAKLVIQFDCGELEFSIGQNNDSRAFVRAINGKLQLTNATDPQLFSNSTERFLTSAKDHSYKCNAEQKIPLNVNASELVLSNFVLEAFRNASGTEFYQTADECPLDSQPVSDLVRIGVGVCLVALVAIVLVAYFIGRRRWSERSSYESV